MADLERDNLGMKQILDVKSIGPEEDEMIETSILPGIDEIKKEFYGVFHIPLFRHYVQNKDREIEMEVLYNPEERRFPFSVHYPRFENSTTKHGDSHYFQKFTRDQIEMLIFAYSEEEFRKFEKELRDFEDKLSFLMS